MSIWLTTDDQTKKLQPQPPVVFSTIVSGNNSIIVDETKTYQTIEGFGASFTDTTGYALNELATPAQRDAAMTNLFTRNAGGIGLSFVRNPMGASDLSRSIYSYDDLPAGQTDTNLNFFSIAHDQVDIIPLVKQALQLNPQLKIMANPWSPPGWMKDSGSMVGGSLLPSMYGPFALYFVKYLQDYQAAGIPVNYISLQNEPLYGPANYPGMLMNAATQTVVLRDYILPALAADHLTNTTVLVYDHNWDRPDYPDTEFADAAINNSPQVSGVAWHGYGGTPGVMLSMEADYPAKGQYLTEHSGIAGNDQVRDDFEEIIHVMRSWGKAYVKWNLASDENYGPHTGGCGNCTPLVYVDTGTHNVSYGIEFYTMGHFSKFVLPGAHRVYSSDGAGVLSAAFVNPDNSKVIVAFNDTPNSNPFQVRWGNGSFSYTLPGYSGATFTWAGTQTGGFTMNAANLIHASSFTSVSNLQTEPSTDTLGGYDLGYASGGSYAGYQNVDLANGFTNVTARLASAGNGGTLEFHVDSPTGPKVGSLTIPITAGWQTWQTVTGAVSGGSGVHDLFARFSGSSSIGNLNWFQFTGVFPPLPLPWFNADIGSVALAGNGTSDGQTFSINGSGSDIWNSADAFHLMAQSVSGACEIRAHLVSLDVTDPWAKAGVMIRDGLEAGVVNVAMVLTPSNGVSFQYRSSTGGASVSTSFGGGVIKAPRWVRLARSASNAFAGYYSSDGVNWTQLGASTTLPMNNSALIGLAVTAHNNNSNCVAVCDSVSVNQSPVLTPVPNQNIPAGRVLTITNPGTDADVPRQMLTYSSPNAPAGATINSSNGVFNWRPAIAQSPATQAISVVVSDNGTPAMAVTQNFTVTVDRPTNPVISSPVFSNGQLAAWINGDVGPDYLLQTSSNLLSWSTISTSTPSAMPFWWSVTNGVRSPAQFYRIILGP